MTKTTWMVRASNGGRLADEFVEKGVAAIGWVSRDVKIPDTTVKGRAA